MRSFPYFLLSGTCLIIAIITLYPALSTYIDPDAVSYFKVAERYVNGDWDNAINAYWSPLSIWLCALLQKFSSLSAFEAALWVNTLGCLGTLWTSQLLFHRFVGDKWARVLFALFFALFWAYADYKQLFADIWQYFFMLLFFLLLSSKSIFSRWYLWPLLGVLTALAYFGKAYAFYFLSLLLVCKLLYEVYVRRVLGLIRAIVLFVVVISVQVLCVSPWVYLLYEKYGILTLSTAGSLNLSWFLSGQQYLDPSIRVIIPPPVEGGIYCFEDPYLYQDKIVSMWQSPGLMLKQLVRVGYNVFRWHEALSLLSAFYFVGWLGTILHLLRDRNWKNDNKIADVALFFLLYPIPFWLMTFDEGRHLWITLPYMVIVWIHLIKVYFPQFRGAVLYKIFVFSLFFSIIVTPVLDMRKLAGAGKEERAIAEQLAALGIKGAFVSNLSYDTPERFFILRLTHFSQNPWYCHIYNHWSDRDIVEDAKRYNVPYYFYFYKGTGSDFRLLGADGEAYPEITGNRVPGLKVFKLNTD